MSIRHTKIAAPSSDELSSNGDNCKERDTVSCAPSGLKKIHQTLIAFIYNLGNLLNHCVVGLLFHPVTVKACLLTGPEETSSLVLPGIQKSSFPSSA